MSDPRARSTAGVPRPLLLMLVYGAFLVIVGVTATAQAMMVSTDAWTTALNGTVGADTAIVRSFASIELTLTDLRPGSIPATRLAALQRELGVLTEQSGVIRVEILSTDGTILVSNVAGVEGSRSDSPGLAGAVTDQKVDATVADTAADESAGPRLAPSTVIREYLPIISDGQVRGVFGLWRDASPILAMLDANRIGVVTVTLTASLVVALLLFFIFRSAQGRITRQTTELLDATRRDPLTGWLTHGAIVEELTGLVEAARSAHTSVGIALVDIDNFRLLNETYGHAAGDEVLGQLSRSLSAEVAADWFVGRYGPDEFLVIVPDGAIANLEPALDRLRAALVDRSLTFENSERLPLTISAGICFYPVDGSSVPQLLSVAAATLGEAQGGGGDGTRVASHEASLAPNVARTFDVLQGLIIAVDTKDRYTKRHSEDVARYADFLAARIDADPDIRRAIHSAGLLHDIGKIGIPDGILRKPGKLTEAEYEAVKQHVALGDMIVRDLPDLELVRAGIRHHHERWDGEGYLHRLAGEQIPLIARILAVGDAFSAMTTTRPYRKALSVDEALRRLEDAAGTQLDERLTVAFVEGIRSADDPPLPGEATKPRIWTPRTRVA